jgi:hypothetical protein
MSDHSSSGKGQDGAEHFVASDCSFSRTTVAAATTLQQETPQVVCREKKKAGRLLEESKKWKRKRNFKTLQQDKLVRETDPNWKPEVSAACIKSGIGLLTFRDRHGK